MKSAVDVAAQLQEALAMASMVSLRNDLAVTTGEWWSFNWVTNVITIPEEELASRPPERIAWVILHEAAHAALTRFHHILPDGLLQREEVQLLLNCVEDLRIEEWLVERFPGSQSWRKISHAIDEAEWGAPGPTDAPGALMRSFLAGLLKLGESNEWLAGLDERVVNALRVIEPALRKAIACRPPANALGPELISRLYASHPVSMCYRDWDAKQEPEPFEKWVRVMQATSWAHIAAGILPEYLRLLELKPVGRLPLALKLKRGTGPGGSDPGNEARMRQALRRELAQLEASPYHRALVEHARTLGLVSDLLAELLPNHRGLRYRRGFRSGDRVDLRAAFQAEADPRVCERVWLQRQRRTLPDPAFVFVMDRSKSMSEMGRAQAAYEALVLVREACTRAGIPFNVIVFNDCAEVIHGWDRTDDERSKAALGVVLHPEGGTSLRHAVGLAAEQIAMRPERDRFVIVLTDGLIAPPEMVAVREERARIEAMGVRCAGIGLGQEAESIQGVFPGASLLQESDELPAVLGSLLVGLSAAWGLR